MNTNVFLNQVFSNAVPAAPVAPGTAGFEAHALLVHGDGTNGAYNRPLKDSSQVNATFNAYSSGENPQGTFTPYNPNGYSAFFDGASYVTYPTGTFNYNGKKTTFEFWVCPSFANTANSGVTGILSNRNASGVQGQVGVTLHYVTAYTMTVGLHCVELNRSVQSTATIPVGKWSHVVIQVDVTTPDAANELIFYINGVREDKTINFVLSTPTDYSSSPLAIGGNNYGQNYFQGFLSNLRIVQGSSYVYTGATLNVPISKLTAIAGTKLLTLQDNRIKDNSAAPVTFTRNGSPAIVAYSPFRSGVAYSAAAEGGSLGIKTNEGLSNTTKVSSYPVTGDFTIEGWVYQRAKGSDGMVFYFESTPGTEIYFRLGTPGGSYDTLFVGGTSVQMSQHFPTNEWNHFALVRSSSQVTLYRNGESVLTFTKSGNLLTSTTGLYIGTYSNGAQTLDGFIAGLKYSKVARYTSNFAVPTAPATADASTYLLLNCDTSAVVDTTRTMSLSTGGTTAYATVDTTVKKFGTGSVKFTGSNPCLLSAVNQPRLNFRKADFTIEFWFYTPVDITTQSWPLIVAQKSTASSMGWSIYRNNNNGAQLSFQVGTQNYNSVATVTTTTWEHWAVTRKDGTLRWFKNGTLVATYANVTADINDVAARFYVGFSQSQVTYLRGSVDELRITPGLALYTANFDVPTAPYSDI